MLIGSFVPAAGLAAACSIASCSRKLRGNVVPFAKSAVEPLPKMPSSLFAATGISTFAKRSKNFPNNLPAKGPPAPRRVDRPASLKLKHCLVCAASPAPWAARSPPKPAAAPRAASARPDPARLVPKVADATAPAMAPSVALIPACTQSTSLPWNRSDAMLKPPPINAPAAAPARMCSTRPSESTAFNGLLPAKAYRSIPPASPMGSRLSQRWRTGS